MVISKAMKQIYILGIFLLVIQTSFSQITVTQNDFANAGDTVRMSIANIDYLLNFGSSGANHTWDFSNLQMKSQRVDSFFKETDAPFSYILYFSNVSINPNRANIAVFGPDPAPILPILQLNITNTVNFFYKNSSHYVQPGFGAEINGFPIPIAFDNKDVIYNFPLNYGDKDTSQSGYSIPLLGVGFYGYQQTRTNEVDGWGMVTTPFGTFDAVRVKSDITAQDTFFVNSFNFGFTIPRLGVRQYKWITNGQKEPVLQINTQVLPFNIEIIQSIWYRDSIHRVVNGVASIPAPDFTFSVYPNPAGKQFTVTHPDDMNDANLMITDEVGRILLNKPMQSNNEQVDGWNWSKGNYFAIVYNKEKKSVLRFQLQ